LDSSTDFETVEALVKYSASSVLSVNGMPLLTVDCLLCSEYRFELELEASREQFKDGRVVCGEYSCSCARGQAGQQVPGRCKGGSELEANKDG
jgi:hypothetical protein